MTEGSTALLHWDAQEENSEICDKIKSAPREVRDPEIGMDVIQLGLIRNVSLRDNRLDIVMILTTPYCPYAPMLMESSRKKAEEATGIPAEITYGTEVWNQTMMEEGSGFDWGLF
mgnify:CR=1 FL=1